MTLIPKKLLVQPRPREIAEKLSEFGVCVIEGYFDSGEAANYMRQFDRAFSHPEVEVFDQTYQKTIYLHPDTFEKKTGSGQTKAFGENEIIQDFKPIDQLGMTSFYSGVLDHVYAGQHYHQPVRWQLVRSTSSPEKRDNAPYTLHYDRQHYFKFYMSLGNIRENDGPITFLLGAKYREHATQLRKDQRLKVADWRDIQNTYTGSFNASDMCPLYINCGDLVIFNSDVPHLQGRLSSGNIRKVIIVESQDSDEFSYVANIEAQNQ